MLKKILLGISGLLVLVVAFGVFRTVTEPGHLYKHGGEFAGCPSRPSCVSSVATEAPHAIDPIRYSGQMSTVPTRLVNVLRGMDGVVSVEREGNYAHAVFATPTMGYRDDLEVLVRPDGTVDVRSISRFGYRDFGVNRDRVEILRSQFTRSHS